MKRTLFALLFFIVFTFNAFAENFAYPTEEKCQNALASLSFYLDQSYKVLANKKDASEVIPYSDEDVEALWNILESLPLYSPYETYTALLSEARDEFMRFQSNVGMTEQKERLLDLYQSYLKIHSLWYVGMDRDPVEAVFRQLSEKKGMHLGKKSCLTNHLHKLLLQKKGAAREKSKFTNLLNWMASKGLKSGPKVWKKWLQYYAESNQDPILTTFLASAKSKIKKNNLLASQVRKKIQPYLLPESHPAKPTLDKIFSSSRVIKDPQSMVDAGFKLLYKQKRSFIHVASHPELPDYLLKAVVDSESKIKEGKPEWMWFIRRCECAKKVSSLISKKKIKHFTVAQKWIYPLPSNPPTATNYVQKPVVLLAKKMDLASYQETLNAWKHHVNKEILKELYSIVSRVPRISIRPDNVPLTKDGIFAFIDTEYRKGSPAYGYIVPHLSADMRSYWEHLIRKGG